MYKSDVTIHRNFGPIFQSYKDDVFSLNEVRAAIIAFNKVDIFDPPDALIDYVDTVLPEVRSGHVTIDFALAGLCDVLAAISNNTPNQQSF